MYVTPRTVKVKLVDTPISSVPASGYSVRVADAATGSTLVGPAGKSAEQMPLGADGFHHIALNQAEGLDISALVGQTIKVGVSAYAPPPDQSSVEVFSDWVVVAQVAESPDPPVQVVLET